MSLKVTVLVVSDGLIGMLLRKFLGVVFIVSGEAKMWDIYGFSRVVSGYRFLPESLIVPVSIIVPFAEFVFGLMLLLNLNPRVASLSLLMMVVMFSILSAVRYFSGDISDCGCFGKLIHRSVDWKFFTENIMLIGGLVVIIIKTTNNHKQ